MKIDHWEDLPNGMAAVLKTAARNRLGVRVPHPPQCRQPKGWRFWFMGGGEQKYRHIVTRMAEMASWKAFGV